MFQIGGNTYQLIQENRSGWNLEAFRDRYSDVLDRYDFIVGDWGYNQLRLKGFFRENNTKGVKEANISNLQDYLNEYCNFGCAYFVVEKQNPKPARNSGKPEGSQLGRTPKREESGNRNTQETEGTEN